MPVVNRGAAPGDQNADTAYAAFGKVNDKFDTTDIALAAKADAAATATALSGKQASDATLTALAALVTAANKLIYATGVDAFALTDLTAFARTLLAGADAAAVRTALGITAAEAGSVVQTVYASSSTRDTTTTAIPLDNTVPQITEGKEFLTLSITPKFANSKIRLRASAQVSNNTLGGVVTLAMFVDAVAGSFGARSFSLAAIGYAGSMDLTAEHAPGDTSAHTYRLRFGPASGAHTAVINGDGSAAFFGAAGITTFVAEEVKV